MCYIIFVSDINEINKPVELIEKKRVSYSQYATYSNCPHKWELDYAKNMRSKDNNINTSFGTAIHHAIQTYLTYIFSEKKKSEPKIDPYLIFVEKFKEEFAKIKEPPANADFESFCEDGKFILTEVIHPFNFSKYFSTLDYDLVGIEIPLNVGLINNINFVGFIDIVLKRKNQDKYKIVDIKTSTNGWSREVQEDDSKLSQLHLYRHMYSKIFNVAEENIDVEFFIVKRKVYKSKYVSSLSRIQTFSPLSQRENIVKSVNNFVTFLEEAFTPDGKYVDKQFKKTPGEKNKNCKYCLYYNKECDGQYTEI